MKPTKQVVAISLSAFGAFVVLYSIVMAQGRPSLFSLVCGGTLAVHCCSIVPIGASYLVLSRLTMRLQAIWVGLHKGLLVDIGGRTV